MLFVLAATIFTLLTKSTKEVFNVYGLYFTHCHPWSGLLYYNLKIPTTPREHLFFHQLETHWKALQAEHYHQYIVLTILCCQLSEEALNANSVVFDLTRSENQCTTYYNRGENVYHLTTQSFVDEEVLIHQGCKQKLLFDVQITQLPTVK